MAFAVLFSAALHGWLIHGYGSSNALRVSAAGAPLTAWLQHGTDRQDMVPVVAQRSDAEAIAPADNAVASVAQTRRDVPQTVNSSNQTGDTAIQSSVAVSALPQSQDATYYSARSLDFFPAAMTPLALAQHAVELQGVRARAMVLIDETGIVNEVRQIDAEPAGHAESAVRELLLRTRFTPARKDGRAVKAQVLISLSY